MDKIDLDRLLLLTLDAQKRALLEQKKVAKSMDDAIETLQTCLRLLDLVHRVGEMIREGKYWGALRVGPSRLPVSHLNQRWC